MSAAPSIEDVVRFHVETAIKLVGRDAVLALLGEAPASPTVAGSSSSVTSDPPSSPEKGRGRRPGCTVTAEHRCSWKMTDGSQCKNARKSNGFCGIHVAKIDLIDLHQ